MDVYARCNTISSRLRYNVHKNGTDVRSQWPWPLTFDHQNLISSSLSPSGCLWQIWRNSLKALLRYYVHENGTDRRIWKHNHHFILLDICVKVCQPMKRMNSWVMVKNVFCEVTVTLTFDHHKTFLRYRVHENRTDRQPETIIPSAMAIAGVEA